MHLPPEVTAATPLDSTPCSRVPAPSQPVEHVQSSDLDYQEFLVRYLHAGRPVVISNVAQDWVAMHTWTPEYFKQRFGSKPVAVGYDHTMPFDQFIDQVLASTAQQPGPYMYRSFLHEVLPELLPDVIPQNKFAFARRYASPLMPERWRRPDGYLKLLVGGVGSKFPVMHFDGEHAQAVITQIYGAKEFVMYAPEDGPYLYPKKFFPNHSMVDDPVSQDLSRFPLLAKATQYRTVLHPGDMVFVPAQWWHAARALTPSISVCTNMLDGSNWDGFVADIDAANDKRPMFQRKLTHRYLQASGKLLAALESFEQRMPGLARALVLPALMAPLSAEVAPEPSRRQLHIRIPTA